MVQNNRNKSLSRGLRILKEIMIANKPLTANTLCQKLLVDKSTMSRLITTLIDEEFIEYKENSKEIILSDFMKNILEDEDRDRIVEKTKAILEEIHEVSNECAYVGVLEEGAVLYLNQIDYSNRVLKTRNSVGLKTPLHTNGFGKILLAFSDVELKNLKLKKHTSNTITSTAKLEKELELIQERGYAIGNEEHEFGLRSVAVPYFNQKNKLIATIGISGLSVRLDIEKLHKLGQEIFMIVNKHNI
ncbi:IclR family transcriptional regulator [Halarcobacter bivalviorum]|uniref:Transcriptional regulator, IclR family n=1 Tax=Halarcobacter bivalviorum TaxID=663364 RepID=A0AB33GQG2_9BACT|nr:IclR family transcriptional regulator [Halarcobacter bivalviorum]AXH12155.1 transcriptional regulator, IclR family [Halarcobacter bivalviorum]